MMGVAINARSNEQFEVMQMNPDTPQGDESTHEPRDSVDYGHEHNHRPDEIRIIVNGQPVVLTGPDQTGASIKQAAISQRVPIQPDFVLSEIKPNGHQKVIPDHAEVTLKNGDDFWAIPGDDNS
jgi:hypothetical protein